MVLKGAYSTRTGFPVSATITAMDARCSQRHPEHLRLVASRWAEALEASGFDAVVVAAGRPRFYQFDDLAPFFRPNPHFTLWFPEKHCEGAALLFTPGSAPALYFHSPADYWHQPAQAPDWAAERFELRNFEAAEALEATVAKALRTHRRVAFIGESPPESWAVEANPAPLIHRLHYQRACKTSFEVACLEQATENGVKGHIAAREAYRANGSEFDILRALVERAGRVVARERLMELARGAEFTAFDRAIDVHISNIRKKLGDSPRAPQWIRTVRGVGYQVLLPRETP